MRKLLPVGMVAAVLLAACGETTLPPDPDSELRASLIAAGLQHTCAARLDGTAVCWGSNSDGQLGTGAANATQPTPTRVSTDASFTALTAGFSHTCGIATDGRTLCWGRSGAGQLGNGANTGGSTPVVVSGGHAFVQISAGESHTCGLDATGVARCWGGNDQGELGNGTRVASNVPVAVDTELRFRHISAGSGFTCAVTTGNQGYCWGDGGRGRFGSSFSVNTRPVALAGNHAFQQIAAGTPYLYGFNTAGELLTWGCDSRSDEVSRPCWSPYVIASAAAVRQIDATTRHGCIIGADDRGYCLGIGAQGQFGDGTMTLGRMVASQPVSGDHRFSQIAAGGSHSCGIGADSIVFCWGENTMAQLGAPVQGGTAVPVAVEGVA